MIKYIQYNYTVNDSFVKTFILPGGFNDHKVSIDLGVYEKGSQAVYPVVIWRDKRKYSVKRILRIINRFFHMASNR